MPCRRSSFAGTSQTGKGGGLTTRDKALLIEMSTFRSRKVHPVWLPPCILSGQTNSTPKCRFPTTTRDHTLAIWNTVLT